MSIRKGRKVYILLRDGVILDVWANLKQLCEDKNKEGKFISYSKLSKMSKESGQLIFEGKDDQSYIIEIKIIR